MKNIMRIESNIMRIKIKDRIVRDIRTLFEQEKEKEDYYEPKGENNFGMIIALNMRVMLVKAETSHLMSILITLNLT